jgi:hypothetical protein
MERTPGFKYRKPPPPKLQVDVVCKILREERGLLNRTAERLGVGRTNLRKWIANRARCALAMKEARDALADVAEKKLYDLIEQGDFRAISFFLSTVARERGYSLPKGASLIGGDTNNFMTVGTVNILSVPAGTFLPSDLDAKPAGTPFSRVIPNDDPPPDTQH